MMLVSVENDYPQFGRVMQLYIDNLRPIALCRLYETELYNNHINAYHVKPTESRKVITLHEINENHPQLYMLRLFRRGQ